MLTPVSLSSKGKVLVEEMQQHLSFFEKALRFVYGDNLWEMPDS